MLNSSPIAPLQHGGGGTFLRSVAGESAGMTAPPLPSSLAVAPIPPSGPGNPVSRIMQPGRPFQSLPTDALLVSDVPVYTDLVTNPGVGLGGVATETVRWMSIQGVSDRLSVLISLLGKSVTLQRKNAALRS